jgi:hypothetical protein
VTLDEFKYLIQEHSIRALWLQNLPEKFVIKKKLQVDFKFLICQLKKEVYKYVNTHEKKSESLFGKKKRHSKKVLFLLIFLFYFLLFFLFYLVSCSLF